MLPCRQNKGILYGVVRPFGAVIHKSTGYRARNSCISAHSGHCSDIETENFVQALIMQQHGVIYQCFPKSEKIIADTLFRYNIPYRYEFPLKLDGYGLVHPDFMVLNSFTRKEYFYEHFGMMDNEQYIKDALKKIEAYEKNDFFPGQELIITSETRAMPLNIRILEKIIHRYFL